MSRLCHFLIVVMLCLAPSICLGGSKPPVKLQVALLVKIFGYDESLASKAPAYRIAVVYKQKTAELETLVTTFHKVGIVATLIAEADVETQLKGYDVAYLATNVDGAALASRCANLQILSVGEQTSDVENGHASIGLALKEDGRPQILINVSQLKREGHKLPSPLLGLAKLYY